jgi:imidazolonepropionase-like amidohydrolase
MVLNMNATLQLLTLFLTSGALSAAPPEPPAISPAGGIVAIRVGRAETATKGAIEHAVILVENGKIVAIGEDLPVERGIPILDRPNWVAMPGLVDAYSRLGLDSEGGDDNSPEAHASDEIYPATDEYADVRKYGVTTLGLYPAGNGIPGQAVAVHPAGKTLEEMLIQDSVYLKIIVRASSSSKKLIRDGFRKADEYVEKEKKAREKWEKDQEAKKKKAAPKKDEKADEKKTEEKKTEEKKEEKKEEKPPEAKEDAKPEAKDDKAKEEAFVPPPPDPKVKPFLDLRSGKLHALCSISNAAEYLHLVDAFGKEKVDFDLRIPLGRESDVYYVADKKTYELDVDGIGDRKCRVVLEPVLTLQPGTMRERNLAKELSRAGAKVVFIPRNDNLADLRDWLPDVGEMVGAGLDREVALRAVTSEPAALMGLESRLGSLEKGKDADIVFLSGDPFQPSTRIQAVMLGGRFVHGEVKL